LAYLSPKITHSADSLESQGNITFGPSFTSKGMLKQILMWATLTIVKWSYSLLPRSVQMIHYFSLTVLEEKLLGFIRFQH
jgi:hypothetical protein